MSTENSNCFELGWRRIFKLILFCLVISIVPSRAQESSPQILTVNYPLMYMAQRIQGEETNSNSGGVRFPAPKGIDPAYWDPGVVGAAEYQRADLILLNGAGYANWTSRYSLPMMKVVNTSRSFEDKYVYQKDVVSHSHGPEGEHAHEALAFTTWLDFSLAVRQAEAVLQGLIRIQPDRKAELEKNYALLSEDLSRLDKTLKTHLEDHASRNFIASHPVYDYLAAGYDLEIRSVHWEPGRQPRDSEWKTFQEILKEHPARYMIWEGQPLESVEKKLNELGLEVIVFDPCANKPEQGDFLSIMSENVNNFKVEP